MQSPGSSTRLRQSGDKLCFVTNTEERVEELVNELDEALRTKILPRSEGEKLRGRLQFASSQVFGRQFRRLLKVLSDHVTQGRKTLSQDTQSCLRDIRELLIGTLPERLRRHKVRSFTYMWMPPSVTRTTVVWVA